MMCVLLEGDLSKLEKEGVVEGKLETMPGDSNGPHGLRIPLFSLPITLRSGRVQAIRLMRKHNRRQPGSPTEGQAIHMHICTVQLERKNGNKDILYLSVRMRISREMACAKSAYMLDSWRSKQRTKDFHLQKT